MKIHSDILTLADLFEAVEQVPAVTLDMAIPRGSRSRQRGYEVALRGHGTRHTRRPNTGIRGGGGDEYAATYDDWGYWLALLFDKDPAMIAGHYKSAAHFHETTRWAYELEATNRALETLRGGRAA